MFLGEYAHFKVSAFHFINFFYYNFRRKERRQQRWWVCVRESSTWRRWGLGPVRRPPQIPTSSASLTSKNHSADADSIQDKLLIEWSHWILPLWNGLCLVVMLCDFFRCSETCMMMESTNSSVTETEILLMNTKVRPPFLFLTLSPAKTPSSSF